MRVIALPVVMAACLAVAGSVVGAELAAPTACPGCTQFRPTTKPWQIQFQGRLDFSIKAPVIDVDGFDNDGATVSRLKAGGRKAICYINAGAWENFRSDRDDFPPEVLGKIYEGYPDERWLDIRRIDLLQPVLEKRIQMCKDKGFDALDPDNLNGFENDTGFPLMADDQLRFNAWLANLVHSKGLAVGLKNDGPQVKTLVSYYDFVVIEECFEQRNCSQYQPFVKAGKAAYAIEYGPRPRKFCAEAKRRRFSAISKRPDLRAYRRPCLR